MSCAICETRKEKRFCPAVHGRICAQCCGEQREVTLDCPTDCPYLQQARQYEKPRAHAELDPSALFLQVEIRETFMHEHEHLILGLTYALAKAARADSTVHDQDLIAALGALARAQETMVNSGLVYDTSVSTPALERISNEVRTMVREYREAEQKHMGYSALRDSDVLRALVFLLRLGHSRTSGRPKSRAFVDFLFAQFPESKPSILAPEQAGSRIVLP